MSCNICSTKCFGRDDNHGSCCTLEDRDWIIGTHKDADEFLQSLSEKLGRQIKFEEVFIEYEEGKKLFPDRNNWQRPECYPALRVETTNPLLPCLFYDTKFRFCTVYDIRPQTCRTYECDYLRDNKDTLPTTA